jgi:hypothetical protein
MSKVREMDIGRSVRFWVCLLCFSPWLLACASDSGLRKLPVEVPFALDKGGETVEVKIVIPESTYKFGYVFGLGFVVNRKDPNDSPRVLKLTGDGTKNNYSGAYENPGVPLKVRLEIESLEKEGNPYKLDREVAEIPKFSAREMSIDKRIADIRLGPGVYWVRVTNLSAVPATQGTPITFFVSWARGKI